MRSVIILAMFGMLLLEPGASSAETFTECLTRCSTELQSGAANCPPPGDEARAQCIQDNQEDFKQCSDGCSQSAPADTPKDAPADTPKEN